MNHPLENTAAATRAARRSPAMHRRTDRYTAQARLMESPQTRQDYMLRAYFAQCLEDCQRQDMQRLKDMLSRTAGDVRTLSRHMGASQREQDLASQLADLRRGLDEAQRRTDQMIRETEQLIGQVKYPLLQNILRCRYLRHMSMGDIAEETHYCQRHITRLHDQALKMLNLPHLPRLK